jgi:hypothetical protein
MIIYGIGKLDQFRSPGLLELQLPLGEMPRMGLLWTFMGASTTYAIFTGIAEVLGGVLLLTRRTTLLGTLVSITVLSNVVMLNFCYDVQVKTFASHLLVMAVFLILPDLRRLANVFVLNRGSQRVAPLALFARRWLNWIVLVLPTVLVIAMCGRNLYVVHEYRKARAHLETRPPLYGIWKVEEFEADGEVGPPRLTDAVRWRRVTINSSRSIVIQHMSDAYSVYALRLDADAKTLALTNPLDSTWQSAISYRQPEPGLLALEGTLDGRKLRARLRRIDESKYRLVKPGFRWIIE